MSKRVLLITLIVIALFAGWYAFRPELLFVDQTVNESLSGNDNGMMDAEVLKVGTFRGLAHDTKGVATIYKLHDGSRVLRFTNFETSNGPDVNVYLVAAPDAPDEKTVNDAGFVSLGSIKGNIGDQNYTLPADLDLNRYQSVAIWCKRFGVNFGAAALMPQ